MPSTPPHPPIAALDPTALTRFGRLELLSRLVVEGVMSGLHRSPFKGFSVEFAEHRPYGPGDEIRHIDWRAFGKTDRYFVREFEEETNLQAYLVLDTSGSMGFAGRTVSKLELARRLAAALAYLMIRQRDAVGLVTFDGELRSMLPARSAPGHFAVLCSAMERARAGGKAPLHRVLHALADRIRRRGLIVILSDGFDDLDALSQSLRHLRHRHHEVLFFHILAPEEEAFDFPGPTRFLDLEADGHRLRVDPNAVRAVYRQRFDAHRRLLRERLLGMDADYQLASTAEPPDRILLDYLARRTRRSGGRSRR
ncbi:DUF58 domain-containing protein [Tautonia sociabilis]|uniref:DUF58 domain-containing protein n=1 Tax=Tautonia sociabilis TaxID=2080755 RepID=A0A432MPF8_9BACT|nr:DUF58 domain-containing protein [Tautonia sociabilis]RUL88975.1 DUF58 domain-containing protein [Tautonia sociabilis]